MSKRRYRIGFGYEGREGWSVLYNLRVYNDEFFKLLVVVNERERGLRIILGC